jgi:hypothetical protein
MLSEGHMKRYLPVLFSLFLVALLAPAAFACNTCIPNYCEDPEMWWPCGHCEDPGLGNPGSHYCSMWQDGSCDQGYWNCYGEGELATPFKASWQVASVRVLTPGTPLLAEVKAPMVSHRSTRR